MNRSQSNGGSGECFHEECGILLWQWQHGDIFTIRPLTGSAYALSRDPSVYSEFLVSLAFRTLLGCTWDFGHAAHGPNPQGSRADPEGSLQAELETFDECGSLMVISCCHSRPILWFVATRPWGTEQTPSCEFESIPSVSGARALQRRVGRPSFILRRGLSNQMAGVGI